MTSFAEHRRDTHRYVAAAIVSASLAPVIWFLTTRAYLGLPTTANAGGPAILLVCAAPLVVSALILLLLRASRGRIIGTTVTEGASLGIVLGNALLLLLLLTVTFYPTLP
jgi:hypothetical protein